MLDRPGYSSVAEMKSKMSHREAMAWNAIRTQRLNHPDRSDRYMTMLAATMTNLWRSRDTEAVEPDDFIMKFDLPEKKSASTDDDEVSFEERRKMTKAALGRHRRGG